MTNKYFNYQGAFWQIVETADPWSKPLTYAIEMDSNDGVMLGLDEYADTSDWEYVESGDVTIDEWFLKSDPNDLFGEDEYDEQYEKEHDDPNHPVQPVNTSKLKAMLEQLNNRPTDGPTRHWSIQYDDDMNRHERLKASLEESNRTVGEAADILGMIRARQERSIEMPPTVILNENKYPDSASLEQAIKDMRERHGDHAQIRIGKHNADDLLATHKNQETIRVSSVMKLDSGINVDLDRETLELIKKLKPKNN